jgi:uracil-DNA glycosylase family 4
MPSSGTWTTDFFDVNCRQCPRLAEFRDRVARENPGYYCRPVPPFGDGEARLLVVGLAPGMHGANRTGRPFTGDYAGVLLYETLHKFGFASHPESRAADDSLKLLDCRITNAVKCLPPDNKPVGSEINTCNSFLATELDTLPGAAVVLALGGIAHRAVIKAVAGRQADFKFAHAAAHDVHSRFLLLDCYHCSRYNTNTGRLTEDMFHAVFERASELLQERQSSQ